MKGIWVKVKGYLAGVVALVACPCHLPITLPLLISLTAGTVFSAWLSRNILLVWITFALVFVAALVLAFQGIGNPKQSLFSERRAARFPNTGESEGLSRLRTDGGGRSQLGQEAELTPSESQPAAGRNQ